MKADPIWAGLREELGKIAQMPVTLLFPEAWSEELATWFRDIEVEAFRPELRYGPEDIQERLEQSGLLLLFILFNGKPEAIALGYHLEDAEVETFYIDTVAVKHRGRGTGRALFAWLAKWAKKMGYGRLALDTELENESGFPLRDFYVRLGFREVHADETGNISMVYDL